MCLILFVNHRLAPRVYHNSDVGDAARSPSARGLGAATIASTRPRSDVACASVNFDELLVRIWDIRASERRMYLRVKEIFALAADYQPKEEDTASFLQIIQNKLQFAAPAPSIIGTCWTRGSTARRTRWATRSST